MYWLSKRGNLAKLSSKPSSHGIGPVSMNIAFFHLPLPMNATYLNQLDIDGFILRMEA